MLYYIILIKAKCDREARRAQNCCCQPEILWFFTCFTKQIQHVRHLIIVNSLDKYNTRSSSHSEFSSLQRREGIHIKITGKVHRFSFDR